MARQKTTLREVLVTALVFSVIVAAMTWYDITPRAPEPDVNVDMRGAFYIDKGVGLSTAPANQRPVIIWDGVIGADSTIDTAINTPITYPQREIGLFFDMPVVPSALPAFYEALLKNVNRWEVAGNIVADLTINYNTDTPDWAAFSAMINEFRKTTHLSYRINVGARAAWFKDNKEARTQIQNLEQNVAFLVYKLDDATAKGQTAKEFVAELGLVQFPFRLIADDGTDLASFDRQYMKDNKYFAGFISDVGNPVHKDENK